MLILALTLFFAIAQTHALVHGTAYGTDPHEHNGAPCHVQAIAHGLTGIPTPDTEATASGFGTIDRPVGPSFQIRPADLRERKPIRAPPLAPS